MSSLKTQMAKGVMWTAIGKYAGIVVQLVISMVLARLISPEDFGVVAIAQVAISFISILSDLGIGAAVIQNKTLSKSDLDSIFTFTILLSIVLAAIVIGASPLIASFYNNEKLVPISVMIAVAMFFNIMSTVPASLFMKEKRFAFIAKRDLAFNVLGGAVSIVYAFMGGGCYALVLAPIIRSVCLLVVNLREYPRRIDWHMNLVPLKKIFSFSVFQLLFNIVNYFSRNLDKLIIGKALNMKDLGYYQKSYSLMMMPLQNVTFVITPVLQPFFSDYQNDKNFIKEKYLKIIKLVATLSVPIGLLLYFTGYEIIYIMFGKNWLPAVPAFEILSWSIPLQMVLSTSGSIFQALNKTKVLFINGAICAGETVLGYIIVTLLKGDLNDFALSWVISNTTCFITCYLFMFRGIFHTSSLPVYRQFFHPIINGAIIFILCSIVNVWLGHDNILLSLIFKCAIAFLSSIFVVKVFNDYDLKKVYEQLKLKITKHSHTDKSL